MAGYHHAGAAYVKQSGSDWNSLSQANAAALVSDTIDAQDQAAVNVSVKIAAPAGTVGSDGVFRIKILRKTGNGAFESSLVDNPWTIAVAIVANNTMVQTVNVSTAAGREFKIELENRCNLTCATTVHYEFATIR